MMRRCFWPAIFALFGALLLAACNQATPTPEPPPQPVSVIVVTATFTPTPTPTPTITSTPTALPRERFDAIEGMEGWYWLYGRTTNFAVAQTDFDYRARFLASEWETLAGPALLHRVLPKCSFNIFDWPMDLPSGVTWPPPGRRALVVPADMVSTMTADYIAPFSQYGGDESSADFETQATNCQAAGQRVLDTLMLAPPSPGYVPTATPLPQLSTRIDDRDPAWSVFTYILYNYAWQPRLEIYYRTEGWTLNPGGYLLDNNALPGCSVSFVNTGYLGGATLLTPIPPFVDNVGAYVAFALQTQPADEAEAAACKTAAQKLADTLHGINPLTPNP